MSISKVCGITVVVDLTGKDPEIDSTQVMQDYIDTHRSNSTVIIFEKELAECGWLNGRGGWVYAPEEVYKP